MKFDLNREENMLLFVLSQAFESYLDKLETCRTVILPLTVSVMGAECSD